jgi:hypothetical protein
VKHLRALTFDLDDTLRDNRPVLTAVELTVYGWPGRHYSRITARYTLEDMRGLH